MNMASLVNELLKLYELSDFKIKFEVEGYDSLKDILKMSNNEKNLDEMFNLVGMNTRKDSNVNLRNLLIKIHLNQTMIVHKAHKIKLSSSII